MYRCPRCQRLTGSPTGRPHATLCMCERNSFEHPEIQNSPLRCLVIARGELPMNNEITATKNRMNTVTITAVESIAAENNTAKNKTITAMILKIRRARYFLRTAGESPNVIIHCLRTMKYTRISNKPLRRISNPTIGGHQLNNRRCWTSGCCTAVFVFTQNGGRTTPDVTTRHLPSTRTFAVESVADEATVGAWYGL